MWRFSHKGIDIIHIVQKPYETLPSQVFQVLPRVIKGQKARSAFRGTVPFGTLRVGIQSHLQVYVVSQPMVGISMMLWLLIISSRDYVGLIFEGVTIHRSYLLTSSASPTLLSSS